MAVPASGTVVYVSNTETTEAIPVVLTGDVEVELGANVGLLNKANAVIDPATEDKQDDAITLLGTIDADTSKIPSQGTAAMVASMPVTVASDDTLTVAANTLLGTIDADTGNIAGGVGAAADAAVSAGAVGSLSAKMRTLSADASTTKTSSGNIEAAVEAALTGPGAPNVDAGSYTSVPVNAITNDRTEIIAAPAAGKQLWIYGLLITVDTVDATILLESAANAKSGAMPQADNGGFVIEPSGNFAMPFFKCGTAEAFNITMAGGVGDGIVSYAVISV